MRVIDVDSHFYEPLDWLEAISPKLASQLPPASTTEFIFQFVARDLLDAISAERMPENEMDLVPGMAGFLDAIPTVEQLTEMYAKQPAYSDAQARVAWCDKHGIDIQLINPNWGLMP